VSDEEQLAAWLDAGPSEVHPDLAPPWMQRLVDGAATVVASQLSDHDLPPTGVGSRQAAVLVLLGDGPEGSPDVLLQQRTTSMRHHPGQVSFPGGGRESADTSPVGTAVREAREETGLDPGGVVPVALLPRLLIPVSGFEVTAVIAHWAAPSPVTTATDESTIVFRLPLARLTDPNAWHVRRMAPHWTGRVADIDGTVIWGYTVDVLAAVLTLGGWLTE
jgi:8-oxo-dGTP pyrophosphatase MutT (NUDIX family)